MARPSADLTGQKFDKLTVLRPAGFRGRNTISLCRCECGVEKEFLNLVLKNSRKKNLPMSCGCESRKAASERFRDPEYRKRLNRTTHGLRRHPLYNTHNSMIERCYKRESPSYPRYGGRGITVCERWLDKEKGLANFIADMGERPRGHTLDRRDTDGHYNPENCRWATSRQQSRNVGKKKSTLGLRYKGISDRECGWTAECRGDEGRFYLGWFQTQEEAAYAYDIASAELQGSDGVPNGITPPSNAEVIRQRVLDKINQRRAAQLDKET